PAALGAVATAELALRLQRISQGRVGGVPVREAAAAAPVDELGESLDVLLELAHETRFADARRSDDGHQGRASLRLHTSERLLQHGELLVAADELGFHPQL